VMSSSVVMSSSGVAPSSSGIAPSSSGAPPPVSCRVNNGGCDMQATCCDRHNSIVCTCNRGFRGNGFVCTDINECMIVHDACIGSGWTCLNLQGSFECVPRAVKRVCSYAKDDGEGEGKSSDDGDNDDRGSEGESKRPFRQRVHECDEPVGEGEHDGEGESRVSVELRWKPLRDVVRLKGLHLRVTELSHGRVVQNVHLDHPEHVDSHRVKDLKRGEHYSFQLVAITRHGPLDGESLDL